MLFSLIFTIVTSLPAGPSSTVQTADKELVHAAVLDYVEAIYNVQPERIERSVHPKLRKVGFWKTTPDAEYGSALEMTFEQLLNLSKSWNKAGNQVTNIKEIKVMDVMDKTAVAKLNAVWGTDFFHLARIGGRWMIVNIVWQGPPAPAANPSG